MRWRELKISERFCSILIVVHSEVPEFEDEALIVVAIFQVTISYSLCRPGTEFFFDRLQRSILHKNLVHPVNGGLLRLDVPVEGAQVSLALQPLKERYAHIEQRPGARRWFYKVVTGVV
jgi:hypothetical protein